MKLKIILTAFYLTVSYWGLCQNNINSNCYSGIESLLNAENILDLVLNNEKGDDESSMSYSLKAPVSCTFTTTQDIGTTLLLSWTPIPGATSYVIRYRLPGGSWNGAATSVTQKKLSYLLPNTYYECMVVIYINGVFWNNSTIGSFTTGNVSYIKTYDMGSNCIISWSNIAPWATSYALQYRRVGDSTWMGISFATNPVKLSNLYENTDYECRISVYINTILWGSCQIGYFHTNDMVINFSQDIGTTVLLTWTSFSWASSYTVSYRKVGTTTWSGVPAFSNQVKVSGLTPETGYEAKVAVFLNNSLYGISLIDTVNTSKVEFNTIADNGTSMQIVWTSFSPWATSYVLQYRLPMSTYWYSSSNTTNPSVLISPVIPGQDYFLRLRVFIGSTLWGVSQESKMGRSNPFVKEVGSPETNITLRSDWNIYPNPFSRQISMDVSSNGNAEIFWNIYDLSGRILIMGSDWVYEGKQRCNINTSDLPRGLYFLNVSMDNEIETFRILKQ